jgi:circadian clock protein KaiC
MNHSNQIREFQITEKGISFVDVYVGPEGVLTGSARLAQEAREKAEALRRRQEIERRKREFEIRKKSVERQIAELQASLHADEAELDTIVREAELQKSILESDREAMAVSRSLHRKSGNGR